MSKAGYAATNRFAPTKDELDRMNLELSRRVGSLERALREIDTIIDGSGDIDSEGRPNLAMQIQTVVDAALGSESNQTDSSPSVEGALRERDDQMAEDTMQVLGLTTPEAVRRAAESLRAGTEPKSAVAVMYAAMYALRSYQHGNDSPNLAAGIADELDRHLHGSVHSQGDGQR